MKKNKRSQRDFQMSKPSVGGLGCAGLRGQRPLGLAFEPVLQAFFTPIDFHRGGTGTHLVSVLWFLF